MSDSQRPSLVGDMDEEKWDLRERLDAVAQGLFALVDEWDAIPMVPGSNKDAMRSQVRALRDSLIVRTNHPPRHL